MGSDSFFIRQKAMKLHIFMLQKAMQKAKYVLSFPPFAVAIKSDDDVALFDGFIKTSSFELVDEATIKSGAMSPFPATAQFVVVPILTVVLA